MATPTFDGVRDDYLFGTTDNNDAKLTIVPEPATFVMLLGGAGLLLFRRRR